MSPSGVTVREAVRVAVRRVRRTSAVAVALAVAALVPTVLLLVWAWAPAGWAVRGSGPLLVVVTALLAALGLAVALARRWVDPVDEGAVAAAAERRRGLPEGTLRGVLELGRELSPGGSAALFQRMETAVAGALSGADARELAGDVGERAYSRALRLGLAASALALVVASAGFAAPERARGAWAPLLNPVAHLNGPALPALVVSPGHAEVARGAALEVAVEAALRQRVTVHWRATGDVPRSRTLPVSRGRAGMTIGPVDAPLTYWVVAPDGARTDSFTVRPVDPLLLSALSVEVIYPPHVGRDPDHFVGEAPPLRVPEGTQLRIRGTATRELREAALAREDGRAVAAEVQRAGFTIQWTPAVDDSGIWEWRLAGTGAVPAGAPGAAVELRVSADTPPAVRITVPEADAPMPGSQRQLVVADASDDYGLSSAALLYRRVSAAGERGSERSAALRVEPGADRLLLRAVLDASAESLVPGDAIHYRVVARDNSPRRQVGASAVHVLRMPSLAELRDRAREDADAAVGEAERLSRRARELETRTRDLSRRAAAATPERSRGRDSGRRSAARELGFEEARQARQVLEGHEEMRAGVAELERRIAELERAIEEAALRDPELERRLQELRELYRELARPEERGEIEALREAVEALDPEAVREALARLAERQEEIRQQIDESLELMRRAAAEQEMSALAREAEELAEQQEALARSMREEAGDSTGRRGAAETSAAAGAEVADSTGARPDSTATGGSQSAPQSPGSDSAAAPGAARPQSPRPQLPQPQPPTPSRRAEQQEEMEERAEELNESMESLRQQLLQIGEQEAAKQTGSAQQKGQSSQQSMQQAAQQARQEQGQQAADAGERAASQMADAARTLDAARQEMTASWEQQVQQALQQATQEALSLAQREEALRQQMEQAQQQGGQQSGAMQQMRSEQAALQQGLEQLGRNLSEAGQQSGMLNREVGQALARAMLDMDRTLQGMQDPRGQMPVGQAAQAVEALNQLATALLQNGAQLQQQAGSSLQQALQQLGELAREQGSLNGRTGALAPLELSRDAMAQQLQQLAQQQRGIARRVGEVSEMMGGRESVLGRLDQLSGEAAAIAESMRRGRLDPDVRARQERLFNRLLDAGRSLEREEYSEERVGERAAGAEAESPDALDPALLDPALLYPAPGADRLRALPPAYRRLILEYFDRLNRQGVPDAGSGTGGGGTR